MKLVITGRLDGLNQYTLACRGNRYGGNQVKQKNQAVVISEILRQKLTPLNKFPCKLSIKWYEPNLRRDIDNITFGVKFILDALVESGIIPDDSQKFVDQIEHQVLLDRKNPRIEVEVE